MAQRAAVVRRRRQLGVELLEARALLSNLAMTLTTDKPVYTAGEQITMTFTETNDGSQPVDVVGVAPNDGFDVTENGKLIWESNSGVQPLVISIITLQPGQSHTLTATWNGVPTTGDPPVLSGGSFTVTNQLDPNGVSASFRIDSPLSYSITTDKRDYSVGQPIQLTYTETNTTSQPVTVNTGPSDFAITQEGTTIPLADVPGTWSVASGTETLQPGQSISETSSWNGVANVGSLTGANVWGGISVSNQAAPHGLTAILDIANPLATGLTASSPSFAAGQAVTLTYTATNTADVPLTVLDSPGSFSIQSQLSIQDVDVFSQTGSGPAPLVTLQPGASLTQTATWNPSGGHAPVGSYFAYFSGPFDGVSAWFQVGLPDSISTTFTTDQSEYTVGQPIQITLSETNTSDQPVTVNSGPSVFQITKSGFLVADVSGTGGTQSATETLQPGQSFTQTATWNGVANIGTSPGANEWGEFLISNENAPQLQSAFFQIDNPVVTSLTASSPSFALGQRVAFALTLSNHSNKRVDITPEKSTETLTIYRGSQVLWISSKLALRAPKTIAAGKSIKLRGTWSGHAQKRVASRLGPGIYTLEVSYDGYTASKSIQIKR